MTFFSNDAWWWPFLFMLLAGWLMTDSWRFLGVYLGGKIPENSEVLVLVRSVATALIAAVIGNLIVFPAGDLADTPLLLRIGAAVVGSGAYLFSGKRVLLGIAAAELVLVTGILLA